MTRSFEFIPEQNDATLVCAHIFYT